MPAKRSMEEIRAVAKSGKSGAGSTAAAGGNITAKAGPAPSAKGTAAIQQECVERILRSLGR